uniref:Synembryn-A n=1 Tax=Lygus hesperus TaxID=30085 RepID=A0A0A9ZGE2_LYGHE
MMFEKLVSSFDCKTSSESIPPIQEFVSLHSESTSLPELNKNKLRERVWSGMFSVLEDPGISESEMLLCLTAMKILIRDKTDLDSLVTKDRILTLMKCAHLEKSVCEFPNSNNKSRILESVKCLYNIILNFHPASEILNNCGVMDPLVKRVMKYDDGLEVKLFDLKLVFLMTAFCSSTRVKLFKTVGGLLFFNELLEIQLKSLKSAKTSSETRSLLQKILSDELKILFNLLLDIKGEELASLCKGDQLKKLVAVSREYFIADIEIFGVNLKGDVINLLTLIPVEHMSAITTEIAGNTKSKENVQETGLMAVTKIMDYLEKVLADFGDGKNTNPNSRELLPPVLLVLLHLAKSGSVIRKHIRKRVLPKLTEAEVFTRPEEGNSLRNKLCRLLTSPITNITDVTADFLFVLCKESVGRMVKYTGYGNAAGLFARRGLLSRPLEYSSDSEGSDTEGYNKHKEFINPIVGCRTPAHPDPLEGMTEEQKEILAMELVNQVDRLMRHKIIQPCVVGPDGTPQPIEHIQQLQQSGLNNDNDTYSDDD